MNDPAEQALSSQRMEVLLDILRNDVAIDVTRLNSDAVLISDLGLDSVAVAIIIVALEDRFGVAVTEKDLIDCRTLGDVFQLIEIKEAGR